MLKQMVAPTHNMRLPMAGWDHNAEMACLLLCSQLLLQHGHTIMLLVGGCACCAVHWGGHKGKGIAWHAAGRPGILALLAHDLHAALGKIGQAQGVQGQAREWRKIWQPFWQPCCASCCLQVYILQQSGRR